jgi:hypothetical protein
MSTTPTFFGLLAALLLSTTNSNAGIPQAKTNTSDRLGEEQMLEWLLINYKMHTRVMCGRLLEHYEADALRDVVFAGIQPDRVVRPDLKSAWIRDLALALGHSAPNVTRVDHDEEGNAAVSVVWAGGGYYFGVTVGTEEFTLKDKTLFSIKCAPGIYVWDSRPPRDAQEDEK